MNNSIVIQKATLQDAPPIAECILHAMEEIVYSFIGRRDSQQAREFMLHFVSKEGNQYSWTNCWVAKENLKIVGAVNIYDGANLIPLRKPVIDYVKGNFNPQFDPENETEAGEFYIDSLGVMPAERCKGIGTKLVEALIEEYPYKQQKTLGLLVDEQDPAAKRLYMKLGFEIVGIKTLVGKRLEHLQFKPKEVPQIA